MEDKKKYRVIDPVMWGERRERGEILELTEKEAIEIGLVEPVDAVETEIVEIEKAPEAPPQSEEAKTEPAQTSDTETKPTEPGT